MSAHQSSLPLAGSKYKFNQYGESGAWLSELLPRHQKIVDDVCFIRSMHIEAIKHDPAITMFQTGSQIAGRPSFGSWLSYGLGSENSELPAFIVLATSGKSGQPLYSRLWGVGFLDSRYQGVRLRSGKDSVFYLSNPAGICQSRRHAQLDSIADLNRLPLNDFGYNNVEDPVHVHDFNATMLHLMGIDHEQLTYKYQGRRFRLTDVHGKIVKKILS